MASDRGLADSFRPTDWRSLLVLVGLTLVPFLALAIWARLASPAPWEPGIVDAIALDSGLSGDVFRLINTLGNLPIWSAVVAIATVGVWLVRAGRAALLVGLSLASDLAAFAVKLAIERQRPDTAATEHLLGPDSFAFPSGHVVRAVALIAAVAWVLAPVGLRFRLALASGLIAAVVMGYARVALGVHWPTDALGGALLGLAWFGVTTLFVTRRGRSGSLPSSR